MPSTSYPLVQPDFELASECCIASSPASTLLPVFASRDVDLQHRPGRPINHQSEEVGRLGPPRGFLPRGLFNACPHALSFDDEPVLEGRRRTNLNGLCLSHAFRDQWSIEVCVGRGSACNRPP